MQKTNQNSPKMLSQWLSKLSNFFYFITTKEIIDPLHEVEVYIDDDMRCSIIDNAKYRGNPINRVLLHCFAMKRRSTRKFFLFLKKYLPTYNKNKRFENRLVTMSFRKFSSLLKFGEKGENDTFFVKSENNSLIKWKIYVKSKSNEPEEIKCSGDIGLPILNGHSL